MLYVLSDPHLSFGSGKPMDIFSGWTDYTERLRKNWSALVTDRDTVVLPGDISWAMDLKGAREDFAYLDALPGVKLIGKGNHDYWWATMKKTEEFPGWDAWKETGKQGMECKVAFRRKNGRIVLKTKNLGIEIENFTTVTDDLDKVFVALTGDQVAITDIRVK